MGNPIIITRYKTKDHFQIFVKIKNDVWHRTEFIRHCSSEERRLITPLQSLSTTILAAPIAMAAATPSAIGRSSANRTKEAPTLNLD